MAASFHVVASPFPVASDLELGRAVPRKRPEGKTAYGGQTIATLKPSEQLPLQALKTGARGGHPIAFVHHTPPSPMSLVKVGTGIGGWGGQGRTGFSEAKSLARKA
jgi:hypothetical protein